MKKAKVIMLAPDLNVQGGISSVVQEYLKANLDQKVDLIFLPTHQDGSAGKKISIFLKALARFLRLTPQMRTTIVHLHTSQNGSFVRKFILFFIARVAGARTIVHIHGSKFDGFMKRNRLLRFLTKYYFDHADRILVTFPFWKNILADYTNNKNIFVFYNPISLSAEPYQVNGTLNILFLGRLGQRKGVYDLLTCISQNKEYFARKGARFILAGDGEVSQVRQFVRDHQLEGFVEVPGWILGDAKEAYWKSSDLLILPSYHEQMPMSILEAMAHGYPIIATNVAGIPEMVKHCENGYLFAPGDIRAMTFYLRQLCDHSALREKMGQKSQELVREKFANTKIVDQLVSMYEDF